ncbi:MAG: outer membrane protein assembly factor BamA [Pseudomonadota bacterium]
MRFHRLMQAFGFVALACGFSVGLPDMILQPPKAVAQQEAPREQSVIVRGNQRIEVETILSYMQIEQDQTVTAEDLNIAVRRLFDTGLFQDVQINPGQNALIVEVVENPSINEIAFEGNDVLADEDLNQIISLRPRLPLTRSAAEADAQAIIEVYRRTGRFGASVEPVVIERSENRVDLVFEISEGELTGVSSIDFIGNEVFSDRQLRNAIDTSESSFLSSFFGGDVYDPDRLELDKELLRQYYLNRGYADFEVLSATAELTPDKESFFLTFTVQEGEEYAFGTFDVIVNARGLEQEEFLAIVPTDLEGEVYDASEVEEIADSLSDLAAARGFAFVQVRPRADKRSEDLIIDVTFELIEGEKIFVERIEIEGNTQTLDRVIRREVEIVEGDSFDARKIRSARSNIRGLGYFSSVEIDTEEGSAPDRAVLKVKVEEQSTGSLSFGLGFASSVGPIGNVALTERNFLGRGQILSATVTAAGDTQVYDFSFTEPKFLDRDLRIGMRAFFIQDDRTDESSFQVDRFGFTPFLGFPLGENTDFGARYNIVRDDIETDSSTSPIIIADEGGRLKSSVAYTITHDQRNDPIEPTSGYLLAFDQEFAGIGGSARFVRTEGSAKTWRGLFDDDVIFSSELEGGALFSFGEDTQINDRFFLGGDSFRGFASQGIGPRDVFPGSDDSLGGNYFLVWRNEVSFPLGLPEELGIFGGAFIDIGSLWNLDKDDAFDSTGNLITDVQSEVFELRAAAGGLLFIQTPFGPLELSAAFPLISEDFDEEELFRVSVGTRF